MADLGDALDSLKNGISGIIDEGLRSPATVLASAIGGAVVGGAITGAALSIPTASPSKNSQSSRKKRKPITHTKRGWKQDRKRRSKQKWEVAYQRAKRRKNAKSKRSSKSRKGIHYTKNGQPYKILSSGKARFIKRRR